MPRWDYDTVFYRVFCITLLGIACTFTVILTNVFIDIDGLLSKKEKAYTESLTTAQVEDRGDLSANAVPETDFYDFKDYGDSNDVERTKRSLEQQDFSFRINDPKIKQVIADRLAGLLQDLDKEESLKTNYKENNGIENKLMYEYYKKDHGNTQNKEIDVTNVQTENKVAKSRKAKDLEIYGGKKSREDLYDTKIMEYIERIKEEKNKKQKLNHTEEELKHLAIHNIILQGIIGHMDLGDVYTRVHALINDLENREVHKDNLKEILHPEHEKDFFNEIINCKNLKEQIVSETARRVMIPSMQITTEKDITKSTAKPAGRNIMIQTIIDITSLANEKTNTNDVSSKENVSGIMKLIYNGKSLRFRRVSEDTTTIKPMVVKQTNGNYSEYLTDTNFENIKDTDDKTLDADKSKHSDAYVPKIYMNKIINEYLKRFSKESDSLENTKKFATKRLKRHTNILYESNEFTTEKVGLGGEKEDDELFVEIETHFDSKGAKGEKKKKIIRDMIQKIQTAIHSETDTKNKKHNRLHVKKRIQNPLDSENTDRIAKPIMPSLLNNLVHRESSPISKSMPMHEKLPDVSDSNGAYWNRDKYSPRFLTVSKSINSAEMSELDTDYKSVMEYGILQRLQKPLYTVSDDETILKYNNEQDANYPKIYLNDISGSGFSIGFNQYVDEQPDEESLKLFTGIKNIIQTYHQKYDLEGIDTVTTENTNQENPANNGYPINQEYPATGTDKHSVFRRSIKNIKRDYHSNEYKIIFNKNFLNYDNYQDVYNRKINRSIAKNSKPKKNLAFVIDDNIFNKDLKPADIFSIAGLLERKKRSLNIRKISKVKYKRKLNRYINTKSMASKKIFQKHKRSKRQIEKIRVIAKDFTKYRKHNTEQDIFPSSDEKIFADRAILKDMPEIETSEKVNEEHYDIITPPRYLRKPGKEYYDNMTPQKVSDYDIVSPYIFEAPPVESSYANNILSRRSRQNTLMSRYPHIFMEEMNKSKEDFTPFLYEKMVENFPAVEVTTIDVPEIVEIPHIPVESFQNHYIPHMVDKLTPQEKSNYKITVKILPKNNTGPNSGFKEIHTSFNNSYNSNGLVYTSLVNVSEISKVEKLNKTLESYEATHHFDKKLKIEHLQIKSLIQQHKQSIDEQLEYLNKKKENLARIDIRNEKLLKDVAIDSIDAALPTNPAQIQHSTKENLNAQKVTTTEQSTTPVLTTTEYVQPITEDPAKIKLINTIEKSEKISIEILKKIDKNTDILQVFLDKLISKMEATTQKPEVVHKNPEPNKYNNDNFEERQVKNLNPQISRTNQLYDQIPNMFFNQIPIEAYRNGTAGIPFIYAFQQPYNMSNNKEVPVANVVYQGHIHANTVYKKPQKTVQDTRKVLTEKKVLRDEKSYKTDLKKPTVNKVHNTTDTRFFLDDSDDFKVFPMGKMVYPISLGNSTKV